MTVLKLSELMDQHQKILDQGYLPNILRIPKEFAMNVILESLKDVTHPEDLLNVCKYIINTLQERELKNES